MVARRALLRGVAARDRRHIRFSSGPPFVGRSDWSGGACWREPWDADGGLLENHAICTRCHDALPRICRFIEQYRLL
jgi:hypothetical protein